MTEERHYPDEPAGPFPEPPVTFEDGEGRQIEVRGYPPTHEVPEPLVEMYDEYDPADRAQGIPPSGEHHIRRWLETIFEDGYNAVTWHEDRAVGHATLVPDEGGKTNGHQGVEEPKDGEPAYELAIFVLQAYQRAGIGTHLLEGLLGYGASQGVETVWLTVERWNRPAVALYERVGFEVVDSRSFELVMTLRLAPDHEPEVGH